MTRIESDKKEIAYSAETIFSFITNFQNFESLLPADKVENFKYTEDSCSFRIKGMTDIGLKRVAATPNSLVYLDSYGKVPFKFTLNLYLQDKGEQTAAHLIFDGEINPFMKMMVETPLTNFFNMLVDKLVEKFN